MSGAIRTYSRPLVNPAIARLRRKACIAVGDRLTSAHRFDQMGQGNRSKGVADDEHHQRGWLLYTRVGI